MSSRGTPSKIAKFAHTSTDGTATVCERRSTRLTSSESYWRRFRVRHFYRPIKPDIKQCLFDACSLHIFSHTHGPIPNHNKLDFRFAWKDLFSVSLPAERSTSASILVRFRLIKPRNVDSERGAVDSLPVAMIFTKHVDVVAEDEKRSFS